MNNWIALSQTMLNTAQVTNDIYQAEKNRQHDKEMAEKAQEYERERWNEMNEYNSPTNQVARLREAGINPAATFGQIAGNNKVTSYPQAHKAPYTQTKLTVPDLISMYSGINQIEYQTLQNENLRLQNQRGKMQNAQYGQLLQYQLEGRRLQNAMLVEDIAKKYNLSETQKEWVKKQIQQYNDYTEPRLKQEQKFMEMYGTYEINPMFKIATELIDRISNFKWSDFWKAPEFKLPEWW